MDKFKSKTVKYKDLPDKPDKILMPDGTLAYPSDDTLIKVDEEGKPLDYSKLAKENYAEVNEDGSYTAVRQLPEIIVTFSKKKSVYDKAKEWVNDNILLNKDDIRVKNMQKALSTESGKKVINDIAEGQAIGGATAVAGVALPVLEILTPFLPEAIGSYVGGKVVDKGVQVTTDYNTWGEMVSDKTGLHPILAEMTNPGSWYGGHKFNFAKNKDLFTKFIKGDSELGWNNLLKPKEHWVFNGGFSPTNAAMAVTNRIMPFLYNVEKTPLRALAYQISKKSKGNVGLQLKDIISWDKIKTDLVNIIKRQSKDPEYTGSVVPGEGKNLLAMYLFKNDPIIKHLPWMKNIEKQFKPVSKRFFRKGEHPEKGITYYKLDSAIKEGNPIIFKNKDELLAYNQIGVPSTKKLGFTIPIGKKKYTVIPMPNTNPIGPLDDIGNHGTKLYFNEKGQLIQKTWDFWDFDKHLSKNYFESDPIKYALVDKQTALMRNAGTHNFALGAIHPIMIGNKKIYNTLEQIPKYRLDPNSRIGATILQQGGIIPIKYKNLSNENINYTTPVSDNIFNYDDIFNYDILFDDKDPFLSSMDISENLFNDIPEEIFFDTSSTHSNSVTSNESEFNDLYDQIEKEYPIAKKYRNLLTNIAKQESGFNYSAKNPNAPAYGYFQFMQGDRWNNISAYAGTDIQTFINNPKLQIEAALRLAIEFENSFTKEDMAQASRLGYGINSLIAGSWLAGAGGVKKFIWKGINVDDKHWSPEGAGVDLKSIMDKYA